MKFFKAVLENENILDCLIVEVYKYFSYLELQKSWSPSKSKKEGKLEKNLGTSAAHSSTFSYAYIYCKSG